MPFSFATFAQAKTDLSLRLYESLADATRTFWTNAELGAYIVEALRTWNSHTSFWRAEFDFTLVQGQWWYDLPSQVGSLRPYTQTDNSLLQMIEYHLLEPLTTSYPLVWGGSSQFDLGNILTNLTQAQNQVLGTSGCTITRTLVNAPIIKQRVFLPDSPIDIRRVAWLPTTGLGFSNAPLRQTDMWQKRAFDPGWTVAAQAPPRTWMQSTEPPPGFDIDRVPPVPGNYDVLIVNRGAIFNTTAAQSLVVPDDWTWLIKWNALAGLLGREGVAKDALRQAYAQKRYDDGIKLLASAPAVLALELNGIPLWVDAVRNGDDFNPGWQNLAQARPKSCYAAGLNLIAFPQPDAGPYSVLVSVVENAPVPVLDGDFIQISVEDYTTILNYAQHLAAFKLGGAEFVRTLPLYQDFLRRASIYNSKLAQMGQFTLPQYEISQLEAERNPRVAAEVLR